LSKSITVNFGTGETVTICGGLPPQAKPGGLVWARAGPAAMSANEIAAPSAHLSAMRFSPETANRIRASILYNHKTIYNDYNFWLFAAFSPSPP
jgi:hypothetical protein